MGKHHEMYAACKHVWITGMKRQKWLEYVSKAVGFEVPGWQYKKMLETVFDLEFRNLRRRLSIDN